ILAPQSQSGDERAPEGVTVAEIAAPGPAPPLEGATVPPWICPTYSSFLPRRARPRSPWPQPCCLPAVPSARTIARRRWPCRSEERRVGKGGVSKYRNGG